MRFGREKGRCGMGKVADFEGASRPKVLQKRVFSGVDHLKSTQDEMCQACNCQELGVIELWDGCAQSRTKTPVRLSSSGWTTI